MKVGIDLGTTNTLVSYVDEAGSINKISFRNGNPDNRYLLPSCIAYDDKTDSFLVGQPAIEYQSSGNVGARRFIRDSKYEMGSTTKQWSVGTKTLTAEDVATVILKEVMRELKSQFPAEAEFAAFVTVPTRFDTQEPRLATKSALVRAGFLPANANNTLTDEPIAAAIAYSRELQNAANILVVDFGGGTFDLALLKSELVGQAASADRLEPIAWGGDKQLGGNDVDKVLFDLIADEVASTGRNIRVNLEDGQSLINEKPEDVAAAVAVSSYIRNPSGLKSRLFSSDISEATVYISELFDGYTLKMTIPRARYMESMKQLSGKMKSCIQNMYSSFHVSPEKTDKVLVVGGMAHEPCLIGILSRMFGEDKLVIPTDSLYLVSRGAAICNSGLKVHVENKAYSSIAVIVAAPDGKGRTIDPIVSEGMTITDDFVITRKYKPNTDNAKFLQLNFVEYKGQFDQRKCSASYNREIELNRQMKRDKQIVTVSYTFNEDKLFIISAQQIDGTVSRFSIRL